MTYLDRALLNNPQFKAHQIKAHQIISGMCPSDLGLEQENTCPVFASMCDPSFETCGECWRREMPDE